MINENKKTDVFDLLETAMSLSDLYHDKDIDKDVNIYFRGADETLVIRLIDWRELDGAVTEYRLKLDKDYQNGDLNKAYDFFVKEFETYGR